MSDLPETERIDPQTADLDELGTLDLAQTLASRQQRAVDAAMQAAPQIAQAIDVVAGRLRAGGRLHYVGAGTSGRLAILDASEVPPTFGAPRDLVCAHIAGGAAAMTHAVEGAEDDGAAGAAAMRDHVGAGDAVIGLSASGGAPYVVAAVQTARATGAWTAGISNVAASALIDACDAGIVLRTGAEPLAGSTRMIAGTAQKIALNTISTGVMVQLGKVYGNLMVDVVASNEKLKRRALRLVQALTALDSADAAQLLARANGRVKIAVAMHARRLDAEGAEQLLESSGGSLRSILHAGYK